jgi:hypothetical protein
MKRPTTKTWCLVMSASAVVLSAKQGYEALHPSGPISTLQSADLTEHPWAVAAGAASLSLIAALAFSVLAYIAGRSSVGGSSPLEPASLDPISPDVRAGAF